MNLKTRTPSPDAIVLPQSYLANLILQLILVQLHTVLGEEEASDTA